MTLRGCGETACDGGIRLSLEPGPGSAATGLELGLLMEGAGGAGGVGGAEGARGGILLQGAAGSSGSSHWHGARFWSDGVCPS